MNKKTFLSALFSLILGLLLALVRTGIIVDDPFPAFYFALLLLFALILIISFIITGKNGKSSVTLQTASAETADACKASMTPVKLILSVASVFLILFSGVVYLISSEKKALAAIIFLFLAACAVSCIVRIKERDCSEKCALLSLFPVYFSCIYLLLFYRINAKTASLYVYAPEALTIIFLIFAAYFNSAVKFGKDVPVLRRTCTLTFLSLSCFEILTCCFSPGLISYVVPLSFVPMTVGFALFFSVWLFIPGMKLIETK